MFPMRQLKSMLTFNDMYKRQVPMLTCFILGKTVLVNLGMEGWLTIVLPRTRACTLSVLHELVLHYMRPAVSAETCKLFEK